MSVAQRGCSTRGSGGNAPLRQMRPLSSRDAIRRAQSLTVATLLGMVALGLASCERRRDPIATDDVVWRRFNFPWVDGAEPEAPTWFAGATETADPDTAPVVSYPLDGAVHPINFGDITVQWRRQRADRVFRLSLVRASGVGGPYDFFVPCSTASCRAKLPPAAWLTIAFANADASLSLTVTGLDDSHAQASRSAPVVVRFSPAPLTGGLYYWSASSCVGSATLERVPFGAHGATPVSSLSRADSGCRGCHSISPDGARLAFVTAPRGSGPAGELEGRAGLVDTLRERELLPAPLPAAPVAARFLATSPDARRVLVAEDARVSLLDARTGALVRSFATEGLAGAGFILTHPAWSPRGNAVAFARVRVPKGAASLATNAVHFQDSDIVTSSYDPVADTLQPPVVQVARDPADPELSFHFSPSYSPDGSWLVFASTSGGEDGYASPHARLRMVAADRPGQTCPSPSCYELQAASQGHDKAATWPRVAPFSQLGGQVFYVMFSAKRDYGDVVLHPEGAGPACGQGATAGGASATPSFFARHLSQIWMSAIDLRRLAADPSADPSTAPVWLPFQDPAASHHLPEWTESLACSADGLTYALCGRGEACVDGACRVVPG